MSTNCANSPESTSLMKLKRLATKKTVKDATINSEIHYPRIQSNIRKSPDIHLKDIFKKVIYVLYNIKMLILNSIRANPAHNVI